MTLAERLAAIRERANAATPYQDQQSDDEAICAACGTSVAVRDCCDFEEGDICDNCAQEYFHFARTDNPQLLDALEAAVEGLGAYYEMHGCIGGGRLHADANCPGCFAEHQLARIEKCLGGE